MLDSIIVSFLPLMLIPLAFALDMRYGDPAVPFILWKHPVCYVGKLLGFMGKNINTPSLLRHESGLLKKGVGIVSLSFVVLITGLAVFTLSTLPFIGWVLALYLAYAGLAAQSLLTTFGQVLEEVEDAPLEKAQKALSQLVSRDTSVLDRDALRKSLADTLSENVTDAVVAPLFWLMLGHALGIVLGGGIATAVATMWMYKAVSTADSMWGYKTEQWLYFGFGAAKADDILAFIPARLSVLFLWVANNFTRTTRQCAGSWPGFRRVFHEARGMESPNSGLPMSAAAWLCHAGLGGPTFYFGAMVYKPWVGGMDTLHSVGPWTRHNLKELARLVHATAYVAFVFLYLLFMFIVWAM